MAKTKDRNYYIKELNLYHLNEEQISERIRSYKEASDLLSTPLTGKENEEISKLLIEFKNLFKNG